MKLHLTAGKHDSNKFKVILSLVILGLILVPQVLFALSRPQQLLALAIFGAITLAWATIFNVWLSKLSARWVQFFVLLSTWLLAGGFTGIFAPYFSNAYLSFMLATQVIFAMYGLRLGLSMLALSVASGLAVMFFLPGQRIETWLFAFGVLAAAGLLSWSLVSAANNARSEAERSTAEANAARAEAQQLAIQSQHLAEEVKKLNRLMLASQDNERRRLA